MFIISSFLFTLPSIAPALECTPGIGQDPGLDPGALLGSPPWTQSLSCIKRWGVSVGGSQADQWDQGSWLRCCSDGRWCVSGQVTQLLIRLGMELTKQAASRGQWTRERCSGFDAVARRRWEGENLWPTLSFETQTHSASFSLAYWSLSYIMKNVDALWRTQTVLNLEKAEKRKAFLLSAFLAASFNRCAPWTQAQSPLTLNDVGEYCCIVFSKTAHD